MLRPFNGGKNILFNNWFWKILIVTCKRMKLEGWCVQHGHVSRPPYLFPWSYMSWTAIFQQRIPCSTYKHVWDITHWGIWRWVYLSKQWRQDGEGKGKIQKPCTVPCSLQPQQMREQWRAGVQSPLGKPKGQKQQSGLGSRHTLRLGPGSELKWGAEKITKLHSPPTPDKGSWRCRNLPTPSLYVLPGSKILSEDHERAEINFLA